MAIEQFSAVYLPIEDRIDFRFNTSEGTLFCVLFTRSITQRFINQSDAVIEQAIGVHHPNVRSQKLVSEFQKDGLKKSLNFKEPFKGGETLPLGADPVLVSSVSFESQGASILIAIGLINNQVLRFSLLPAQLQAVMILLEKLALEANWQVTGVTSSSTPTSQQHVPRSNQVH